MPAVLPSRQRVAHEETDREGNGAEEDAHGNFAVGDVLGDAGDRDPGYQISEELGDESHAAPDEHVGETHAVGDSRAEREKKSRDSAAR